MARKAMIVVATALASASPASAGQDTSLCDFVMGVLEAKAVGFEPLKGEAQNPAVFHYEVFHGAVLPNPNANCTLFLRTRAGRITLPPRYSCTIAQADDFADANRVFQRTLTALKACLPRAAFATTYDGDGQDPNDTFDWIASTEQPGYKITLEMSNGLSAAAAALSQNNPNAPRIAIDLDVTDTSEEK